MMKNTQLVNDGPAFDTLGLVHRVRIPTGEGLFPTLVMVHGFKGNEDVTWVFARTAGPQWLIVSPRASYPIEDTFSWNHFNEGGHTDLASLKSGLDALTKFANNLPSVYPVDRSKLVLLGFSQGAGMSYAFAMSGQPMRGIAALSGFIPGPVAKDPLSRLNGLPIIMLHGTKDDTIPIDIARKNRDQLIEAGADVSYHEDEIGHKVSAQGMRELSNWLAARL